MDRCTIRHSEMRNPFGPLFSLLAFLFFVSTLVSGQTRDDPTYPDYSKMEPGYPMADLSPSQITDYIESAPWWSMPTIRRPTENLSYSLVAPISDIATAVEEAQRTLSMHEAAGDKIAQAIKHANLAVLYATKGDFEKASEQRSLADRMANEISDPNLQADVLRSSAASHLSLGEFDEAIED